MGNYSMFLKESDLFSNLTQTQLDLVESICEERIYQPGEIIFSENTRSSELYLILQGQVDILVSPALIDPNGSSVPSKITSLSRGQSFGEIALVDEGIRSATARAAAKNTRLLRIPRQQLLLYCNTNPELGYRVMLNLAMDLALKIRNTDLRIRETLLYQANGKIDRIA